MNRQGVIQVFKDQNHSTGFKKFEITASLVDNPSITSQKSVTLEIEFEKLCGVRVDQAWSLAGGTVQFDTSIAVKLFEPVINVDFPTDEDC